VNLADYLRRQFAYNAWANQEVIAAIRAGGYDTSRSLQLLSHVLAAEQLWLERLKQVQQTIPVWPEPDLAWCDGKVAELKRRWSEYLELATSADLSQTISYKNSKGESWTSTILDVLTHVILHSAYHRGQIASHMREMGGTPAYTDFIHAVRQGFFK